MLEEGRRVKEKERQTLDKNTETLLRQLCAKLMVK